jgi:hypothetical protein
MSGSCYKHVLACLFYEYAGKIYIHEVAYTVHAMVGLIQVSSV